MGTQEGATHVPRSRDARASPAVRAREAGALTASLSAPVRAPSGTATVGVATVRVWCAQDAAELNTSWAVGVTRADGGTPAYGKGLIAKSDELALRARPRAGRWRGWRPRAIWAARSCSAS
jgi:hypothetical protein